MALPNVRPCRAEDLDALLAHIPTPGHPDRHTARFERQLRGDGTFLIAWQDELPVATGEIRWQGCAAKEIRRQHPGCPELNGLDVWPPTLRSTGIGTTLITAAELIAYERGRRELGIGVDDKNTRAAALYLRLGYRETGHHYLDRYSYLDDAGIRHEVADPARFLIKPLG